MPRARAIRMPSTNFTEIGSGQSMRMVAGSMGAAEPAGAPIFGGGSTEPDNDAWARQLAAREAAEGLPPNVAEPAAGFSPPDPARVHYAAPSAPLPPVPSDLSGLPERFTLEIEQKPDGWWKVTAPSVHVGLFVARQDPMMAVADALPALAQIVRLDGQKGRVGRRKKS